MSYLSSLITKLSYEINSLGDRVSYIEECTTTVNDPVDAYEEAQEENPGSKLNWRTWRTGRSKIT